MWALALRLTGGATRAEELVQEAWVRSVEKLDRFEGRSALGTWLCGILVNCYREQSKRWARDPLPVDPGAGEREEGQWTETFREEQCRTLAIDVERALAQLAPGYRAVVVLFDINGFSHQEIAQLLGIDEGTSKSQLARGRARLREILSVAPEATQRPERSSG